MRRKLLIWNNVPTHHLSAFFGALRERDFDLQVHYFDHLCERRTRLGWRAPAVLPPGERYVEPAVRSLRYCPDWQERTHIITGYRPTFLLRLATLLSMRGVRWLHWSEPSRPRLEAVVKYPIKRLYGMLVDRYALGALAIGECARRDFRRWGIRDEKIRFLPYSVPAIPPAQGDMTPPSTGIRFLYLGEQHPRKGIDVLLKAFQGVLQFDATARLDIVGSDRTHGRYARLAQRLGISHAVRFAPSVEASRISSVLLACDVVVLPSRFDGWGVVLNEAASAGKALVSTEGCGAAHHLIEPGVNGFRVPACDSEALANAMLEYCRDRGLAARHGAASRGIFDRFTPERNAIRLGEALDALEKYRT